MHGDKEKTFNNLEGSAPPRRFTDSPPFLGGLHPQTIQHLIPMKIQITLLILAAALFFPGLSDSAEKGKPEGVPANYPLTQCVVSKEPLGTMGKPVKVTHDGTEVYLCCKSCIKKFQKDPAKYVALVKAAKH